MTVSGWFPHVSTRMHTDLQAHFALPVTRETPAFPVNSGGTTGSSSLPPRWQQREGEGPPDSWTPQIPEASPNTPASLGSGELRLWLSHLPEREEEAAEH